MAESNEIIQKGVNIDRDSIPFYEQKKYLIKFWRKIFWISGLEKRINRDNLICMYKNEEISSKYFRNYKHPVDLFENLRDGNINPKEELKSQINFKSDLSEI